MEGRGPYHIYDPGGGSEENGSTALERLVEENARLKEKMQGIKSIGELLEESQVEASKLRQKAEDLVKDNKMLIGSSSLEDLVETGAVGPDPSFARAAPGSAQPDMEARKSPPSDLEQPPNEDANLLPQLQQLENTLSGCAKEASKDQVFVRMGYMASELKRLASKVHKNEQRTSFLQTLCETLHSENKELRTKLEHDLEQRNQALEKLRCENQELRRMVTLSSQDSGKREAAEQSGAMVEKAPGREELEAKEKKVKILEHQRRELLEVNKQWDQHFRSMKQKYEQKVTDLHQELAEARRAVTELESEREQKQRDFDRKLLLAKSRIETEEAEKERLAMEVRDLQQRMRFLQEQLAPVTRQREYQEKEIQRLNKALEEALNVQASPPPIFAMEPAGKLPQQELLTQNELLKQQVKIFEEDFQRERSDRERMNEEKEELKQQLEKLQKQLVLSNNQLRASKDDCQREKEEKEKLKKLLKQHKQVGIGGSPPWAEGLGTADNGWCWGWWWAAIGISPASVLAPCRLLERGCTPSQGRGHWAQAAPCTSTSTAPPWLTPCTTATTSGSRSDTRQPCQASTPKDRTSIIFPRPSIPGARPVPWLTARTPNKWLG
uniref:TNFAIP3-interacting protein 1 n=1 Tax=Cyanoderma ruficeps TaxID=181631 RepID=A0A8C3NUH6_9PASS